LSDNPIGVESRRIAMLIDGDNAQASLLGEMLAEASKYGLVTVRRIYGDWTTPNMGGWKDALNIHAIQPIQQFRYTVGKNATDSAMIIDAMDILYTVRVDGFCIVSSDSDYTRLATRIREKSLFVMGIGKKLTPRAFVNACDIFVYEENLPKPLTASSLEVPSSSSKPAPPSPKPASSSSPKSKAKPKISPDVFKRAFDLAVQEDGWAFLGTLGSHLRQLDPGFDPRTYGYKQLSLLIKGHPEIFEIKPGSAETSQLYVKLKPRRTKRSG
jgi:NYN domain/OST-HTH/LOTUS domain